MPKKAVDNLSVCIMNMNYDKSTHMYLDMQCKIFYFFAHTLPLMAQLSIVGVFSLEVQSCNKKRMIKSGSAGRAEYIISALFLAWSGVHRHS
jgi:hypothetical protein